MNGLSSEIFAFSTTGRGERPRTRRGHKARTVPPTVPVRALAIPAAPAPDFGSTLEYKQTAEQYEQHRASLA